MARTSLEPSIPNGTPHAAPKRTLVIGYAWDSFDNHANDLVSDNGGGEGRLLQVTLTGQSAKDVDDPTKGQFQVIVTQT